MGCCFSPVSSCCGGPCGTDMPQAWLMTASPDIRYPFAGKAVGRGKAGMRTDGKPSGSVALIKTAMIEKKITQAELADAADCHEKTIQNLLAGRPVRDQTLFDVCMVLGLDFELVKGAWLGELRDAPGPGATDGRAAPVYMGAYTRAGVDHYIGSYLTLRPSFSNPTRIMAYRTDISWDEEWPSLLFQELDRPDKPFLHRGRLYIPASSMYIRLLSLNTGAMSLIMLLDLYSFALQQASWSDIH